MRARGIALLAVAGVLAGAGGWFAADTFVGDTPDVPSDEVLGCVIDVTGEGGVVRVDYQVSVPTEIEAIVGDPGQQKDQATPGAATGQIAFGDQPTGVVHWKVTCVVEGQTPDVHEGDVTVT